MKILILRLSAIGDTIHTLPLLNALKTRYPDCTVGWVVEDKAALFVKNHPNVDNCYVLPKKLWKQRGCSFENVRDFFKIIKTINDEHYDIVLDTQQLLKSSLIFPFLKIKRKITLSGGREFSSLFSNEIVPAKHKLFDPEYHVVNRNLELAQYLGAYTDKIEFNLALPDITVINKVESLLKILDKNKKTVTISPATTWANKHWDEAEWKKVAACLSGRVNLVFTGMENDLPLIERIAADVENPVILAGKTNLDELAEVFRCSDAVISPDSGSAHIAWAVEKPFVMTIFTATAAKRNAPFGENCAVFYPEISCYPCMKRKCIRKTQKNLCCKSVSAEKIVKILKNILHYE